MKNRIVVFANQKGGVGKSTLCMLFADYLAWKKQDVCIIDTDLQKSITMQRKKDRELFEQEDPYTIQDFDVTDPETMQQLMDSARETEGYVLFDSLVIFQRMDLFLCLLLLILSFVHTSMKKRRSTLQECLYRLSTLCNKELLICMRNFSLYPIV